MTIGLIRTLQSDQSHTVLGVCCMARVDFEEEAGNDDHKDDRGKK